MLASISTYAPLGKRIWVWLAVWHIPHLHWRKITSPSHWEVAHQDTHISLKMTVTLWDLKVILTLQFSDTTPPLWQIISASPQTLFVAKLCPPLPSLWQIIFASPHTLLCIQTIPATLRTHNISSATWYQHHRGILMMVKGDIWE